MSDYDKLVEILDKSNEVHLSTEMALGTNDKGDEVYTKILLVNVLDETIELFFDEKDNIL